MMEYRLDLPVWGAPFRTNHNSAPLIAVSKCHEARPLTSGQVDLRLLRVNSARTAVSVDTQVPIQLPDLSCRCCLTRGSRPRWTVHSTAGLLYMRMPSRGRFIFRVSNTTYLPSDSVVSNQGQTVTQPFPFGARKKVNFP